MSLEQANLAGAGWPRFLVRLRPLVVVFVALASPLLLIQAMLIPPGYSPDEHAHAARAESLLHGAILGMRGQTPGSLGTPVTVTGVWADPAIVAADTALPPGVPKVVTGDILKRLLATPWSASPSFVPLTATPYFPIFYLPEALGMAVVRLGGGPPLVAIYAGRLVSAGSFVVLGALALALAERGAALLFATLMMPLTLWLAASLNQDGVMIAAACLTAALLTRAERGSVGGWRARGLAAVGLAMIFLAKPPYAPLAALLLLPFRGTGRGATTWMGRAGTMVLAVVPAVAWSLLIVRFASGELAMAPYLAGPLYSGAAGTMFQGTNMQAQLHVLLSPAVRLLSIPIGSAIVQFPDRLHLMVSGLGLLDIILPGPVYAAWLVALLASLIAAPFNVAAAAVTPGRPPADWFGRGLAALAVLGCVFLAYVALYLSWTKVGMEQVEGVQGRYFLPLLPFLVLCLPRLPARPGLTGVLAGPAVVMAAAGLVLLPLLTVRSLYIP